MVALAFSLFLSITILFYTLLHLLTAKKTLVKTRMETYFTTETAMISEEEEKETSLITRIFSPIWNQWKRNYTKRLDKEEASKLEMMLLQAGQPFQLTPVEFKLVQTILAVLFPLIGIGYSLLLSLPITVLFLSAMIGFIVAIILPKQYLKKKAEKRSQKAMKELPDLLDLLTISLEAGLGFDAALNQVVAKKDGILAKEFKIVIEEMRLGKTRKEALLGISNRLLSEDLKALVASIIQAEKLGVGMVTVLRVQTEDLRLKRKQRAEETAMKAPIKMMFPLVLFIFPTLFIILLGPAVLQLIENFQ